MAKDIEKAIEDVKGKKFGVSINNIIAIVTFLSTAIAGWYSFTGRIDSLEEVVQGFAEASDIEIVRTLFICPNKLPIINNPINIFFIIFSPSFQITKQYPLEYNTLMVILKIVIQKTLSFPLFYHRKFIGLYFITCF